MKFRIALCDDEEMYYVKIKSYLETYMMSVDDDFSLDYYPRGEKLLEAYTVPGRYDIIFMDIEMDGILTGLDTAKKIRELPDKNVKITILSNYPRYLQAGYHVNAHSFLIKPLKYGDFEEEMNLLIDDFKNTDDIIPVTIAHDNTVLIHLSTLLYVDTVRGLRGRTRLQFHTNTEVIVTIGKFKDYEELLIKNGFSSPCKNCLVNLMAVKMIQRDELTLKNGEKLPLSKNTYREFSNNYVRKLTEKIEKKSQN